ncbi:VanZ family protein [uncultured Clostridium sp.]|uniref:VanZ family protein n=1 Tax=uncultured Clostridium sp. TaxID=59620 RepID=UPI0026184642|nr:VanZ family protein [uncultured Clostridium sp.]
MIVVTQNMFLFFGVIICLFLKRNLLISIITRKSIDNNLNVKKEVINLIFFVYIVGVISKVYFPFTMAWGEYVRVKEPVIILNPINSIKLVYGQGGIEGFIYNFGGNLILLMPMGMFISYYFNNIFNTLKKVFISMFLVSLFIESTQVVITLIFPNVCRYFETSDLLLNSIGGALGWKIYNKLFDMYNNKILSALIDDI